MLKNFNFISVLFYFTFVFQLGFKLIIHLNFSLVPGDFKDQSHTDGY